MKTTTHYKGHRWTTEELRKLMQLWAAKEDLNVIVGLLNSTEAAVLKMVQKLRKNGVPLERRDRGHVAGRSNKPWTQGEVEYLLRQRVQKATSEDIAIELGRSRSAVNAMIAIMRNQGVPVAMRGNGVRRLWNADSLKGVAVMQPEIASIEAQS